MISEESLKIVKSGRSSPPTSTNIYQPVIVSLVSPAFQSDIIPKSRMETHIKQRNSAWKPAKHDSNFRSGLFRLDLPRPRLRVQSNTNDSLGWLNTCSPYERSHCAFCVFCRDFSYLSVAGSNHDIPDQCPTISPGVARALPKLFGDLGDSSIVPLLWS